MRMRVNWRIGPSRHPYELFSYHTVDNDGRPPAELGVNKSVDCDSFPFSALTFFFWLGDKKGVRPVKKLYIHLYSPSRWWHSLYNKNLTKICNLTNKQPMEHSSPKRYVGTGRFDWSFARLVAPVTTTPSSCKLQHNPDWRHSGTVLPRLSWQWQFKRMLL